MMIAKTTMTKKTTSTTASRKKIRRFRRSKNEFASSSSKLTSNYSRCTASIGTSIFEKAYSFLKEEQNGALTSSEVRSKLISILGEDSIGFWAILDQILFLENLLVEIKD